MITATASLFRIENSDGTSTRFRSETEDFTYSASGDITSGTVTKVEHLGASGVNAFIEVNNIALLDITAMLYADFSPAGNGLLTQAWIDVLAQPEASIVVSPTVVEIANSDGGFTRATGTGFVTAL